jgi:hypothetical protein
MSCLPACRLLSALARVSGVRAARAVSPCVVRFESWDAFLGWVPTAAALRPDGSVVEVCPAVGGRCWWPSASAWFGSVFGPESSFVPGLPVVRGGALPGA